MRREFSGGAGERMMLDYLYERLSKWSRAESAC